MAESEACIGGMEALLALGVKEVEIRRDSALVIAQAQGKWRTKDEKLKPYQEDLEELAKCFDKVTFRVLCLGILIIVMVLKA